jgi:hypothetical protein
VIAAVVVVVAATAGHPAPGLHGDGRGVLLALVAFAVGLVGAREARLRRAPARVQALLVTLLAGSAALMWLQPDGPGFLGFFYLATWLATLRCRGGWAWPPPGWRWRRGWRWCAPPAPTARSPGSC